MPSPEFPEEPFFFGGDPRHLSIYIHGHGRANCPYIGQGRWDKNTLHAVVVAKRLNVTGFPTAIGCDVKCYTCNSSTGANSFARVFADIMRQNNDKNDTYHGYHNGLGGYLVSQKMSGFASFLRRASAEDNRDDMAVLDGAANPLFANFMGANVNHRITKVQLNAACTK